MNESHRLGINGGSGGSVERVHNLLSGEASPRWRMEKALFRTSGGQILDTCLTLISL